MIALTWTGVSKVTEDEGKPMLGVVVWSNAGREKAVIWCEDQASLAYLQGSENLVDPTFWPEPGDLLELDSEMIGDLRHARRVSVLSERSCVELPEMLRQSGSGGLRDSHLKLVASREPLHAGRGRADVTWMPPLRVGAGGR